MNRSRDHLKRLAFTIYKQALRCGVHIIPAHYYSPLPNIVELERSTERWAKPSAMAGIHVDLDEQLGNLATVCRPFIAEVAGNAHYRYATGQPFPRGRSRFFGYIEAQVLHAVIRYYKPARIIEIGGGVPSYCSRQALTRNANGSRVVSIEPDPVLMLQQFAQSDHFELIARPIQDVPLDLFTGLTANDVVFIDSNHTVKAGGEVNYIVQEILPILPTGVLVQFHDIYLPYDYDRDVLRTFYPPNETPLIAAFLSCNLRYQILFSLSMLHYGRREEMQRILPEYQPEQDHYGMRVGDYDPARHFPSSLWLRVV